MNTGTSMEKYFRRYGHRFCQMFGEAEAAGDLTTADSSNQAMAYASTLPDPSPQNKNITRKDLWCHVAAQKFAQVGPEHHEEFY